jgi:hypothetical protein
MDEGIQIENMSFSGDGVVGAPPAVIVPRYSIIDVERG